MKKKKAKAKKLKVSEPISIVSHNLKTPLSVIKGYLEFLLSGGLGDLNEQQAKYVKHALENTVQMIVLVKDILDVERIESNQMVLSEEEVDLFKITEEIVKDFLALAKAKNCTLFLEHKGVVPLVKVDPIKISQVISNLISNSIIYNKRKGNVKIRLFKKGKNIVFCCEDTGTGISVDEKRMVFSKFFRSPSIISLAPGGSGLGLFISKAILDKSGGKIWFESKKEKGSNFCFSLPLKKKKR